jgi:hypothetical protein
MKGYIIKMDISKSGIIIKLEDKTIIDSLGDNCFIKDDELQMILQWISNCIDKKLKYSCLPGKESKTHVDIHIDTLTESLSKINIS